MAEDNRDKLVEMMKIAVAASIPTDEIIKGLNT